MKTIYFAATSLDGYIADSENSLNWLFQFGEPESNESGGNIIQDFLDTVGVIAMGSTTYQWILDNQPGVWPYKVPCFVFTTRTLTQIPDADIRFVKGDILPVHQQMVKLAHGKNIWVMGGGELAGKFYDQKLLNEIQVHLAAVTLGSGAQLFPRHMQTPMELVSARKAGPGFAELIYKIN
jgi:dihydrofolate reductase